jgi:hypothetical protein
MSTVFTGKAGVDTYRAIAIKHGLKLYADTGMKPNRFWTPMAMLKAAGDITGKTFKRGQYAQAIYSLEAWIIANGTTGEDQ